jgi:hypothetical protein
MVAMNLDGRAGGASRRLCGRAPAAAAAKHRDEKRRQRGGAYGRRFRH